MSNWCWLLSPLKTIPAGLLEYRQLTVTRPILIRTSGTPYLFPSQEVFLRITQQTFTLAHEFTGLTGWVFWSQLTCFRHLWSATGGRGGYASRGWLAIGCAISPAGLSSLCLFIGFSEFLDGEQNFARPFETWTQNWQNIASVAFSLVMWSTDSRDGGMPSLNGRAFNIILQRGWVKGREFCHFRRQSSALPNLIISSTAFLAGDLMRPLESWGDHCLQGSSMLEVSWLLCLYKDTDSHRIFDS